jgi:hypothetical protein
MLIQLWFYDQIKIVISKVGPTHISTKRVNKQDLITFVSGLLVAVNISLKKVSDEGKEGYSIYKPRLRHILL